MLHDYCRKKYVRGRNHALMSKLICLTEKTLLHITFVYENCYVFKTTQFFFYFALGSKWARTATSE